MHQSLQARGLVHQAGQGHGGLSGADLQEILLARLVQREHLLSPPDNLQSEIGIQYCPISGQYYGYVTSIDQYEVSIQCVQSELSIHVT